MRRKKTESYVHKPSTKEVIVCLHEGKSWMKFLLNREKPYQAFLVKLLENGLYDDDEGINVQKIASASGYKAPIITKWFHEIYADILGLNHVEPELFNTGGIEHHLSFNYFGNWASWTTWLPQSPRIYDRFTFSFIKAKLGTDFLWVKDIYHRIEEGKYNVHVMLEGGDRNRYREWLIDKGLYKGVIGFLDAMSNERHQLDKTLKDWDRKH